MKRFQLQESKLKPLTANKNSIELLAVQRRKRYAAETWSNSGYSNVDQYQSESSSTSRIFHKILNLLIIELL